MNTIDKAEYFLRALRANCHHYKAWVIEAFAEVEALSDPTHAVGRKYPYALTRHPDRSYTFIDPETRMEVTLEGTFKRGAPFQLMEPLSLTPGDLENVRHELLTCYGNALVNAVCLIYPFGSKVEFQTGLLSVKSLEKLIEKRLTDNDKADEGDISIAEYKQFNDAIRHLEGFTQLCVPSASIKTMTVSPHVIKRRNELFEQYKGQLNDPVIQARIDKELSAMEREWMKGDPADRFYISDKSYDVVRKRMHRMIGSESGFGKTGEFIQTSLTEGLNVEDMPSMINALRNGSYSRGALTALGGVGTKRNYRTFQNTTVIEEDCGSKLGLRILMTPELAKHFVSSSIVNADGTVTELTSENIDQYVNKRVTVRSVAYCHTPDQNVCAVCVGKKIAATPNAISTYAADLGSTFLVSFLAAAHGAVLKVTTLDYLAGLE